MARGHDEIGAGHPESFLDKTLNVPPALLPVTQPRAPLHLQQRQQSFGIEGNQWFFDTKAHIGVDSKSGLLHTAGVTTDRVHDAKVMDELIREDDRAVFADKGYANEKKKRAARGAGGYWAVKEKVKAGRKLSASQHKRNRRHGATPPRR